MKPQSDDYGAYYQPYIDKVGHQDLITELKQAKQQLFQYLNRLNDQQALIRYQPDKWSIKEMIQHLIDTERVFSYRALSVARESKKCSSFDHNEYVVNSNADYRNWSDLMNELEAVHTSTVHLFNSFNLTMLSRRGEMADNPVTVNALAYIIAGHQLHHTQILKQKYWNKVG